jgi:hypothetical protein
MSDRCQPHYHVIFSCLIVKAPFWVGDFLYFLPQRTLKSEHVLSVFHVWWYYPPVIKRAWEIPELNEIGNCPERHFSLMTPVANYSQDHHHRTIVFIYHVWSFDAFYTHWMPELPQRSPCGDSQTSDPSVDDFLAPPILARWGWKKENFGRGSR